MTDAQIKTLIDDNILTGGRRTTASNERDVLKQLVDDKQNIDGKNQASGYCGLDVNGKVATAQLGVQTPAGSILWDDGSYKKLTIGNRKFNGDGVTTQFSIAHGMGTVPTAFNVNAASADACGLFYITADATNIIVNYLVAPIVGVVNVELRYSIFR